MEGPADSLNQSQLRIIQHHEEVTHNASPTCRFFGISRSKFCFRMTGYRKVGVDGLVAYHWLCLDAALGPLEDGTWACPPAVWARLRPGRC